MKTFEKIYEELQSEDNNQLKETWNEAQKSDKKSKKIAKTICFIIDSIVVLLFLHFFNYRINLETLFFMFFAAVPTLIVNFIIFIVTSVATGANKKYMEFSKNYKNIVINKLMNNFYDNLEYFPNKGMPEYIYKNLRYENYNRYRSEDYFEALINNKYGIQMGEILTQEERRYKDKDGETQTEIITKFSGLFAKIQMDKSINSELKIGQNGALTFGENLKMDSSEFEKYFDVQATKPIIGMQLLTADVMEDLVDFENKTNMRYDIYIKENELYLRFHSGPMFEARNLKNGALDKNEIQQYFYMLNFTYNLSNKLINVIKDTQI